MIPDLGEGRERKLKDNVGLCQICQGPVSSWGNLDSSGFFEKIEFRCPTDGVVYELNRGSRGVYRDFRSDKAAIGR